MRLSNLLLLTLILSLPLYASQSDNFQNFHQNAHFEVNKQGENLEVSFSLDTENITALIEENLTASSLDDVQESIITQLPVYQRNFRLPPQKSAYVAINDYDYEIVDGIVPDIFYDLEIFENYNNTQDAWYPENIVTVSDPAIMCNFSFSNVSVIPYQYNPALNQMRVITNIDYDILFEQSSNENTLTNWPTEISEIFYPFYQRFLDWEDFELDNFTLYRGNVLVIMRNYNSAPEEFDEWVNWKRQKGYELEFLTMNDCAWDRGSIKNEIQSRYDEAEVKYDFIVVIGDNEGALSVPAASTLYEGDLEIGDHEYACLAGNDVIADAAYGRISVESNAQLVAYVNKVLSYERDPYMNETDWYVNGVVAAGAAESGISTVFTCEYAHQQMLENGYQSVNTIYFNDNGGEENTRIVNGLNEGASFHVYRGVAGTGLEIDEIFGLDNANMLPFVIDITCGRGDWANDTSINEAYMRAGSVATPKGGIGAISTAWSTHTSYNNCMVGGAVESIFANKQPSMGEALLGSKFNLYKNFSAFYLEYIDLYNATLNLMGDPTLWIWTAVPRELDVVHATQISSGQNGFAVQVNDDEEITGGHWVTLYKSDDNEEVIARGVADENGYVCLDTPIRFTGEAILTVTARNAQPYRVTIPVNNDGIIAVESFLILDDGNSGSSGNGNGIAECGETVALTFDLHNYSNNNQQNVSLQLSSEDSWVTNISGNPQLNSIGSGTTQTLATPVLVEISDNAPDDWNIEVGVSISTDGGDYADNIILPVNAQNYICTGIHGSDLLEPGENGEIFFNFTNIGHAPGQTASINVTGSPWLDFVTETGLIEAINPGETATSNTFDVSVFESAFRGTPANIVVTLNFQDGRTQELAIQIPIGINEVEDPTGPDSYGYYAFDEVDEEYLFAPSFKWWEINPNSNNYDLPGTALTLPDYADNEDCSILFNMPFDFTYYGQTYDEITVCSNGWIAVGDQVNFANGRNWSIPSPLGPNGMIAPFWDDRTMISNDDSGVYYYYAQSMGMLIIQWDNVYNIHGECPCTFQLIIFEENQINPAASGDNEFMFQYNIVEREEGDISDVPYWTTGIENLDQTDGLQLCFFNVPSQGTEQLNFGRSILFTTRTSSETGLIHGQVNYSDSSDPIGNVKVSSTCFGYSDFTDANGDYEIEVPSGVVTLIFSREGFDTVIEEQITVHADSEVEINTTMGLPVFVVSPERVDVILDENETHQESLVVQNNGSDPIEYSVSVELIHPNSTGQIGDVESESGVLDIVPDLSTRACFVKNDQIWTLQENGWNRTVLSKFTMEGESVVSSDFPGYYYRDFQDAGGDNIYAFRIWEMKEYEINPEWGHATHIETIDLNFRIDGPACYDYQDGYFFIADLENSSIIDVYDDNQDHVTTIDTDGARVASMYLNYDDPDGMYLLYYASIDNEWGEPLYGEIRRVDPLEGMSETLFTTPPIWYMTGGNISLCNLDNPIYKSLAIYESIPVAKVKYYRYAANIEIATINSTGSTIQGGEEQTLTLNFDSSVLPPGNYESWVVFNHDAPSERFITPITVQVGGSDVEDSKLHIPSEWSLDKVWPNPFNPVTSIQFSLPQTAYVNLKLYNLIGQEVLTIADREMRAGVHKLSVNGSELASGMYFIKLQAGQLNEVRKIMLIK